MVTIIKEKNTIKIGKEPMVILPLKKWEKIEELLEDFEDTVRFNKAISDPENQKTISLKEVRKKYNLQ